MIVISDTSPITNLAAVDKLDLLRALFGIVVIPPADSRELEGHALLPPGVEVREVGDHSMVMRLLQDLDLGEAEALALAVELKADRLLIDERRGREVAARLGLRFIGVLGVLLEAKDRGHIAAVRPVIDQLSRSSRFWLSDRLRREVLKAAGEADE